MNKTLFTGVRVLDCTGADPFDGEVLVEGNRIVNIARETSRLPREDAEIVEPDNRAISDYIARARGLREDGEPTLPSTLGLEKAVNPFLRCHVESVRHAAASHAGADLADVVTTFAQIRRWKDGFA